MSTEVVRPVWRRFQPKFASIAATHVRKGGHAAIVHAMNRITLLLPVNEKGQITELGLWSLLSIEKRRWRRSKEKQTYGLAMAVIRDEYCSAILDWCDRDSVHPGHQRKIILDCLECSACCHDANVIVDNVDFERWRKGGRSDLIHKNYIRQKNGRIVLRFLESGKCQHLMKNRKCRIYEIRPDNCRDFVTGSEACLSAREETLGIRDGAVYTV